ncbi:MAG TPA: hypothetical protein VFQ77_05395 [Pseudonocardiaceae bacterium]|nr:hypothetical protein [Pseudonocardiaceae bacterium]
MREENARLREENAQREAELERVSAELAVLRRLVFGRSWERARSDEGAGEDECVGGGQSRCIPRRVAVCRECSDWYVDGMKIAVSLPEEQVVAARRAVAAGRAPSVSAYVSDALARAERENSLAELLADLDRELGEPSTAARAWAEQELRRTGLIT